MLIFFLVVSIFFKDTGHWPVSSFKRICPPIKLWVVQYFGILCAYNFAIYLGVHLLSFLKYVPTSFLFALLFCQLN
jgi:hypothetical protein